MVRKSFHFTEGDKKWARVRDEGDKITLTVKEIVEENSLSGVNEAEVVIHDFEAGVNILKMTGFYEVSFQETRREVWQKENVHVMVDTWPGLRPIIEVEASTEEDVIKTCKALGLDMQEALFGGIDVVYEKECGLPREIINTMPIITFADPPVL